MFAGTAYFKDTGVLSASDLLASPPNDYNTWLYNGDSADASRESNEVLAIEVVSDYDMMGGMYESIYIAISNKVIRVRTSLITGGFVSGAFTPTVTSTFTDTSSVALWYLVWTDVTCSSSSSSCDEEDASTQTDYQVFEMKYDGSYGQRVLLFIGESYNSAASDNDVAANLRIDKLNLNYTDTSTNTDQEQSVNLFNYRVSGTDYHA